MKMENAGVGPAKLVSLEIFLDEQPIRRPADWIERWTRYRARPPLSLGVNMPMVMRAGDRHVDHGHETRRPVEALWGKLNTRALPDALPRVLLLGVR